MALLVALAAGGACDGSRPPPGLTHQPPADAGAPEAAVPAPDGAAGPVKICPGSTGDPAAIALVGRQDDAVVAVRADGAVMRVPLGRPAWTSDSMQVRRSGAWTVVLFVSSGERGWNVMWFDARGNLAAHVRGAFDSTAPPLYQVRPVTIAADGEVVIGIGPKDYGFVNDVIVRPDGSVERRPAGEPDADGWLAIEAGFFRVGTGETRPLAVAAAYGKRRLAMAGSPARLFYLAEVDGAAAFVAETATSSRVMPLPPLTHGFSYALGPFDITAGAGDTVQIALPLSVPVARHRIGSDELTWLVPRDVGPTPAGKLLRPRTGPGFTLVTLDDFPLWSVEDDTGLVVDYRGTPLGAVQTPILFFGTGKVFAFDSGTGRWWRVDRASGQVSELDLGVGGARVQFVAAGSSVLYVVDGLPAILDLDRGVLRPISVPGVIADPQRTRLFPGGSRILFVADGMPMTVLDLPSGELLEVAGRSSIVAAAEVKAAGRWVLGVEGGGTPLWRADIEAAEVRPFGVAGGASIAPAVTVMETGRWMFGTDGDRAPLWRADVETAEIRPFLPALPADLRPLNDPRFLVDAGVMPSPGAEVGHPFFILEDGTVALARRDDVSARVLTAGPDDPGWRQVGRAMSGLWGVGVQRSRWHWTVSATNLPNCFCNVIPQIRWDPAPAGGEIPIVAPVSQLLPQATPEDPLISPPAAVLMNPDQSCAVVTPSPGGAPFALDFQTGDRFQIPALTSILWVAPAAP
jgi:hypothetical protein